MISSEHGNALVTVISTVLHFCVNSNLSNYSSGSIEIDPIDVSNLRRFSSRRNRIGSNRTNVTKSAVQWEYEYVFFALTLNPMGKRQCLEIEDYAGGYAAKVQSNKSTPSLSKPSFAIWSHSLRSYCRLREIDVKL